jgi:hypothetical protein
MLPPKNVWFRYRLELMVERLTPFITREQEVIVVEKENNKDCT